MGSMLNFNLNSSVIDELISGFDLSTMFEALSSGHILAALLSATVCGLIIYFVYRFFYRGVVYSDNFNMLIVMISVITSFVIMTISANIVLSLGMVGALSIVRFRTAVKDPLDIGFLFWSIGAGLTAGAGLFFVALIGTVFIAVLYIVMTIFKKERKNYLLIIRYNDDAEQNVQAILGGMKYRLKSKMRSTSEIEMTIEIKVKNNDTTALSRFKGVEGVTNVTLLEYTGEYMN